MSSKSSSPSFSPKRRNQLVSSLVDRLSPKNSRHKTLRRIPYDRITDLEQGTSLPGGERTSPVRATEECSDKDWQRFCIDSDDEYDHSDEYDDDSDNDDDDIYRNRNCNEQPRPPRLPSLVPLESIPSNYICPLTLQIMEDPVQDCCGHTFERRAILEWLEQSNEAVCPISQKPLVPLGYYPCKTAPMAKSTDSNSNNGLATSTSYDRVLRRNEGLQRRIREWKLEHPLYQGMDADYAQKQRRQMLRRNTITADTILPCNTTTNQNCHQSGIDCPYGGETNPSESNNDTTNSNNNNQSNNHCANRDTTTTHHKLSRFDLMLLPQERQVLKTLKERSQEEQDRLDRSRRCLMAISIVFAIFFLIVMYLVARSKEETTSLEGEG